jgi:hypothetical protein
MHIVCDGGYLIRGCIKIFNNMLKNKIMCMDVQRRKIEIPASGVSKAGMEAKIKGVKA